MAQSSQNQELIDRFVRFYRNYYSDEISRLAQRYPNEQRSLHLDYDDLYTFDQDLADDFLSQPEQIGEFAEEALRVYDLPADVSLGQAHVRLRNHPETVDIRSIRVHDNHVGRMIAVSGIIRKATDVRPKITEAAFECQRCGTMTYIPQSDGGFQEPHECQGCERQGPFRVNYDQSEFVDSQKLRVQESPEGLRGGETPQSIDIDIEDDITGKVTAGDHVTVTGVLHIDQVTEGNEKSQLFDLYMDGVSVEIEDEQFEDMEISEQDKRDIVELSNHPDIYEEMIASVAPSIYGYDEEKLAMILQLFSGVTKDLPDGSRIRGDLHMLLIGDPGTGKCQKYNTKIVLGDGTERMLGELVESRLEDPVSVDDGVYQSVDFSVQTVTASGTVSRGRATKVWKREAPDRMYRIRTKSGREVEVTPSHPLFVQSNLGMETRKAEELTEGTHIALPRRLDGEWDDSLDIDHYRVDSGPANRIDTPKKLTPELARLLGYQIGEGHINGPESSATATVTNADEAVLDDVADCLDSLGLHWWRKPHHDRDGVEIIGCSSVEFVDFLREIEPAILEQSADQRVPDCLFRASPSIKREFLKAYVEGEGHVSRTEREITVASMSQELLEGVRSLLVSLGIETSLGSRQNGSYRLRISGTDFVSYVEEVGFVTERKTAASTAFTDISENTNTDIVPDVSEALQRVREALALSQFDCGIPRTTYQHYERGDRNPSRESLRTVLDQFEARLEWLGEVREQLESGDWSEIERLRRELNLSQDELADAAGVSQKSISNYERSVVTPDGGVTRDVQDAVRGRIDEAMAVADDLRALRRLVENDISWDCIETIETVDPDYSWVYDLEVAGTHTYLGNGIVSHNSQLLSYIRNIAPRSVYTSGKGSSSAGLTAAAVRDDFGEGQQWSLEAGALVLADQGIAAVDELDKMRPEDRSAMHQALEQQEISISKAGINATLKSRCSLLGAANPKYGRFDQYEPIGEQIDLEPALISRFDLIFTVTDQPDPEEDAALAEHILRTNYAGELNTQRTEVANANHSQAEVESVTDTVDPAIDPELLRKYIAYAKRTCYPTMADDAKAAIRDFYVDLRAKGADEDAPVPVTARKLEALVRLAEASARVRLSDTVEREDAERVIDIVRSCLQDIGVDPETGEFDADVIETGTSKSQRDRIKSIKDVIETVDAEYEGEAGAPLDAIVERAQTEGIEEEKVMDQIEQLRRKGDVYSPMTDQYKVV
ncbi:LAGLIDADG family homing endonuclease [Haloplanus ruber]|uniref:DNA helicase n=1 Tax=Haloplanus ruber TaxID=869892 RepID=A0ABD6CZK1_9EURY|nr:LAGLIDADG family homing endonuclease [Haloplanus ruber]